MPASSQQGTVVPREDRFRPSHQAQVFRRMFLQQFLDRIPHEIPALPAKMGSVVPSERDPTAGTGSRLDCPYTPVEVVDGNSTEDRDGPVPDLLGRAVVDLQPAGSPTDVDPQFPERDLVSVDPLVGVPDDEQIVGTCRNQCSDQPPFFFVEILCLVHHDGTVGKDRFLPLTGTSGFP